MENINDMPKCNMMDEIKEQPLVFEYLIKKYIEKDISEFHIPRWEEIPDIDLYLDQTVTILEKYLESYVDEDEKIITKTMINNYVKQQLLEPPVNKKYNREHIANLFIICILKQIFSINDLFSRSNI